MVKNPPASAGGLGFIPGSGTLTTKHVSISFTVIIQSKKHCESESAEETTRILLSTVVLMACFAHLYFSFPILEMEKCAEKDQGDMM